VQLSSLQVAKCQSAVVTSGHAKTLGQKFQSLVLERLWTPPFCSWWQLSWLLPSMVKFTCG